MLSISCAENPLDPTCSCGNKFGPFEDSKIYNIADQKNYCCGAIGYDVNSAFKSQGTVAKAGAAMDIPACSQWWTSTIDPTVAVASNGSGPSNDKLDAVNDMIILSKFFPPPKINAAAGVSGISGINGVAGINGAGVYSCAGIKSEGIPSVTTVPRYVSYVNPDQGPRYINTVACVPRENTDPYKALQMAGFSQTGDFAISRISGCSNLTSISCAPPNGIINPGVGVTEFTSGSYEGNVLKPPDDNSNSDTYITTWYIVLIVMVILFVLIMAFLGYIYYKGQNEAVVTPVVAPVVAPASAVIVSSTPVANYKIVETPASYRIVETAAPVALNKVETSAPVAFRTVETPASYRIVETSAPANFNTVPEFSTSYIDTESLTAPLVPQIYRQSPPVPIELPSNFSTQSYY